jgi:hypothetical protein
MEAWFEHSPVYVEFMVDKTRTEQDFHPAHRISPANYEACPESKDTKVLKMYNIFNLQDRHCE